MNEPTPAPLPSYPGHASYADHSQAKPLIRMMSRMLKLKPRKSTVSKNQNVKIKQKKIKYY